MPKSFRVLLLLTLPLLFVAPAQAEPVAALEGEAGLVTLETRVTQRVVRQDDSGAEEIVYLEDTWLAPGAILRYELIVHNQAENEAVAADSLVITSPLPEGVRFLEGLRPSGQVEFTLSGDGGGTFLAPSELAAETVTHLRWRLQESLPPDGRRTFAFEARLL
jgi:hypothetical protein